MQPPQSPQPRPQREPPALDAPLLDTILEASHDQIYVLDADGCFVYVCPGGAAMLALPRELLLGKDACSVGIAPVFQAVLDEGRARVRADGLAWQAGVEMDTPHGPREFRCTFAPASPGTPLVICTARDVSERNRAQREATRLLGETQEANARLQDKCRELAEANAALEDANARLHALATEDGLTGLLNYRALRGRLEEEFQRAARHGQPLSLLLLDIDHFKDYNDVFGHPAGDAALVQVAEALRAAARETDALARHGGEEFFAVLPQTTLAGALTMAERIRCEIEHLQTARPITVSIGAAACGDATPDASALIGGADTALYRAKAAGRNTVRD